MEGLYNYGAVGGLLKKAKEITSSLDELISRADELLTEGGRVEQDLENCSKFRSEQLMKHLAENSNDEEQMQLLRENVDLKVTVDEFHGGIELIMAKYREHCDGDMFCDSYQLRERYLAGLEEIIKGQNSRIEHMVEIMQRTSDLVGRDSDENQQLIRQLSGENEQIRRQLQISNANAMFRQGSLGSSESSTQLGLSESTDPDALASAANSFGSLESFLSCLSHDEDTSSECCSVVSELDVTRFIEEALGEMTLEQTQPE